MSEKVPGIYAEEEAMGLHFEGIRRGLENFQSHPRVTPDDAALLMCGINPARKQGIKSSDKTAEEDYQALRALFQAKQDKNGGHKTLAEWLALAEKKRHKHHPIVREYSEFASNQAGYECLTTDAHASAPAPAVDSASTEPKPAPQSVPVGQPEANVVEEKAAAVTMGNHSRTEGWLTTSQIATVFDGLHFTGERWGRRLSDTKWISPAKRRAGEQGGAPAMWCPLALAKAIHARASDKKDLLARLNKVFNRNELLTPHRAEWAEYFQQWYED